MDAREQEKQMQDAELRQEEEVKECVLSTSIEVRLNTKVGMTQ